MKTTSILYGRLALLSLAAAAFLQGLHAAEPFVVKDSTTATHSKTGIRVVKGTVDLPRDRRWELPSYRESDGLTEVYLAFGEELEEAGEGERMAKLMDRRATRGRRNVLRQIYYECRNYARENEGFGPKKLEDLEDSENTVRPVGDLSTVYLFPGVRIMKKNEKGEMRATDTMEPLLLDLAPSIGDGKHWIINNRGIAERVEIDRALVSKLGLKIVPQSAPHGERGKDRKTAEEVGIYARLSGAPGKVLVRMRDSHTKEAFIIEWDTASATEGQEGICNEWAEQRLWAMSSYLRRDAPMSRTWAERTIAQYGLDARAREFLPEFLAGPDDRGGRGRTTDIMGMLGGRAAIQETLQLRNLRTAPEKEEDWKPSVPIAGLAGVQVEAHPFEKMLGGKPGGSLPLAEWVPAARFMVYFPQPEKIFSLLEGGTDFLFDAGASATGRSASYQLEDRYRDALGLSEEVMKRFLKTGAIEEMAVVVPDLFLIDGTEVSVLMRTGRPLLTNTALALIGIPPGDGQTVRTGSEGEPVYWVRRGSILIVGTNQSEVQAILEAKEKGTGLGTSAELRYMLTQVPVTDETVAYAYLSDPFIRHLVGPKAKIGQLRRMLARSELEEASAGSLLAKFDGHGGRATQLPFLQERGYVRMPVYAADLALDDQSMSRSGFYGRPARLTSLLDQPLELVSPKEEEAYAQYFDEYNRYWRRYFDPIAVRYEQKAEGQHELETFILPLIDNSLYGGLREFLPGEDEQLPLRVPVLDPPPIALLSCNLKEDAWMKGLEEFTDSFEQVLGLDPTVLDLIGPDLHLAVQDADPIITLGNGELQGMLGSFGGDGSEMMAISAMVSVLTRPCTVHIGLQDPDRVRKLLSEMAWAPREGRVAGEIGAGALYQITGQQRWIYKYTIEDVITLRFGIEVQDRYLVINNLPFSNRVVVTGNKLAPNGAAYLELNPAACAKQLPALFNSAAEGMRANALSGAACLMPLVAGGADLETAKSRHLSLFGFVPIHPGGGRWEWDPYAGMMSSLYGSTWDHRQPEFDPDNHEVGLLQGISQVAIGMQFEQDGLRSKVSWKTRE